MNKITKIMLGVVAVLIVVTGTLYYTNYTKSKNTTASSSTNSVKSQVESINWANYTSNDITLDDKSVEITKEGTYTLTGTISNGQIKVNVDGNVKLILNGVTITNGSGPAIYIENGKVEVETVEGTTNILEDGSSYSGYEDDVNGVIFSKDDLILSGKGILKVTSNYEDAIVSKDDLKVTSGTYEIIAKDDALRGTESVEITDGEFNITSGGDAIKSTKEGDSEKGFVLISGGEFNITSEDDGISAQTNVVIKDGTFNIKTTGVNSSDAAKGIVAESLITIEGGEINIDSGDDGIHSNGNISITAGKITINSSDDGIHADGLVEIGGGDINITAHEGIEGTYVKINDGTIYISASDDGINAGNKSSAYQVTIEINGGNITIAMGQGDTDGIDSNGNIYVNGGTINITGNSPFDYDGEAKYNGGTIIVNGVETNTITNQFMGGGMMQGNGNPNAGNTGYPQGEQNQGQRVRGGMR